VPSLFLATAVAINLEDAPTKVQEAGAANAIVGAVAGEKADRRPTAELDSRIGSERQDLAYPAEGYWPGARTAHQAVRAALRAR